MPISMDVLTGKVHADDRADFLDAVAVMQRDGELNYQYRITRNNGTVRHLHEVGKVLYSSHGISLKVSGFSQDVTDRVLAEEALMSVQEQYKTAAVQGNLGHWQWDTQTNEITWSDHLYAIFDLDKGEKIDFNKFMCSLHPDDRETTQAAITAYVKDGDPFTLDHRIITRDGDIRHIREEAQPYKDVTGNVVRVSGIAQDISKTKIADDLLKRSQEKYRFLFEKNPVPLLMVDYTSLKIVQANDAALKQYGYTREEFLQVDLRALFMEDDRYLINHISSEAITKEPMTAVVRQRNKGGQILDIRFSVIQMTFDDAPVWLIGCINVSYEVMYERQLKQTGERLSLIFNSTRTPMWLLDVEKGTTFRYLEINSAYCFHTGYDRNRIIGQLSDDAALFGAYPSLQGRYMEAIREKRTSRFSIEIQAPSGKRIADVVISPITNDGGEVTQLLCSATDITEKKRHENELLEKNQQLRELTSHLHGVREEERTHIAREIHDELGQLLTAIKMDIAWVNKNLNDEKSLRRLHDTLLLIDETINSVRKISSQLRPSILDDLGLPEAIVSYGNDFALRTRVAFYFEDGLENTSLSKDHATTLYRIFQEALTNIIRHSAASSVHCRLFRNGDDVILTIRDNGVGMDKPEKDMKPKTFGLIGMAERISMLNGHFEIASNRGQGTELRIGIPLMNGASLNK
jgi:PAS domain S-box-containing protein